MFDSAQKAPVASAALTALNVAVVRQYVFKYAAQKITRKAEEDTQTVVKTAEETRNRHEAVSVAIQHKDDATEAFVQNVQELDPSSTAKDLVDETKKQRGTEVDLKV